MQRCLLIVNGADLCGTLPSHTWFNLVKVVLKYDGIALGLTRPDFKGTEQRSELGRPHPIMSLGPIVEKGSECLGLVEAR